MAFVFPAPAQGIDTINYGTHRITPLYPAPVAAVDRTLNICSRCLSSHPTMRSLEIHMAACAEVPYPPIYQEDAADTAGSPFKISVVPDPGTKQLLCMLSCMFIKNKTVFYDIFHYEVFIIHDTEVMGYFSRPVGGPFSLSCVFVWPCFARQGLGSLLIDFSYLKVQGDSADAIPGPERPFSRKAIFCFRKYWKYSVIGAQTVRQAARRANISVDDAIVGLELNGFDFRKWEMRGEAQAERPRLLSRLVCLRRSKHEVQ